MTLSYDTVHHLLAKSRGKAAKHKCACGRQAQEWAYLHLSDDEVKLSDRGYPYSENMDDYLPMCRKCHRTFDSENATFSSLEKVEAKMRALEAERAHILAHPSIKERRKIAIQKFTEAGNAAQKLRRQSDPEFAAASTTRIREAAKKSAEKFASDPAFAKRVLAGFKKAKGSSAQLAGLTRRYRCSCGFQTTAGALAMHQRGSGHIGREPA